MKNRKYRQFKIALVTTNRNTLTEEQLERHIACLKQMRDSIAAALELGLIAV